MQVHPHFALVLVNQQTCISHMVFTQQQHKACRYGCNITGLHTIVTAIMCRTSAYKIQHFETPDFPAPTHPSGRPGGPGGLPLQTWPEDRGHKSIQPQDYVCTAKKLRMQDIYPKHGSQLHIQVTPISKPSYLPRSRAAYFRLARGQTSCLRASICPLRALAHWDLSGHRDTVPDTEGVQCQKWRNGREELT